MSVGRSGRPSRLQRARGGRWRWRRPSL